MKIISISEESPVAINNMGGSSSTPGTGGIDTFDPKLKKTKKLKDILNSGKDKRNGGKSIKN